ncbi:hypothetical protein ACLOJK_026927 [Asimina triloba]
MMMLLVGEDEEDVAELLLVVSRFAPSIAKEGATNRSAIVQIAGHQTLRCDTDLQRTIVAINGDAEGSIIDFHGCCQ